MNNFVARNLIIWLFLLLFISSCEQSIEISDKTVTIPGPKSPTLQWQRTEPDRMAHSDALTYCNNLVLEGIEDWRLPTIQELFTIIDFNRSKPAADTKLFPSVKPHYYWSSTNLKDRETSAWYVYFFSGGVGYDRKTGMGNVRCVRVVK